MTTITGGLGPGTPNSGSGVSSAGSSVSFHSSGNGNTYDAQVVASGGAIAGYSGHAVLTYTAAIHNFDTFDGSTQFRVLNQPQAVEMWQAAGGVAGKGATLLASSDSSTNVNGRLQAAGTGGISFGNDNGLILSLLDSGGVTNDSLQITPAVPITSKTGYIKFSTATDGVNGYYFATNAGFAVFNGAQAGGTLNLAMGQGAQAYGAHSHVRGFLAYDHTFAYTDVWGNGQFAVTGDCQVRRNLMRGITTDATPRRLTSDGTGTPDAFGNSLQAAPNFSLFIRGNVNLRSITDNVSGTWTVQAVLNNTAGTTSVETVTVTKVFLNSAISTVPDPVVTADVTNNALAITVTGLVSNTMHWQFEHTTGEVG